MSFEKTVEAIIREAQARGEFDNLPGKGRPIDLTEYFNTPEDVRVAGAMLKNAGMVPMEIELLQEKINRLRTERIKESDAVVNFKLDKQIEEDEAHLKRLEAQLALLSDG